MYKVLRKTLMIPLISLYVSNDTKMIYFVCAAEYPSLSLMFDKCIVFLQFLLQFFITIFLMIIFYIKLNETLLCYGA